jgi:hypothetical protein
MTRLGVAALAVLGLGSCAPEPQPMASLQTAFDHGTYRVTVGSFDEGYPVRFSCVEDCPGPVEFVEHLGDHPLGLFSRDQDELIFYLSGTGVGYRVWIWQVSDAGIKRIGELGSRGRPDFLSDAKGHAVVQTYEANSGVELWQPVRWTFDGGKFVGAPIAHSRD